MYSVPLAYFLWLISGFGALGFHRFYLGKIGTGILYALTGGLGMVGSVYDFFTLPGQVREANIRSRFREAIEYDEFRRLQEQRGRHVLIPESWEGQRSTAGASLRRDSPERIILRVAKKNQGIATPSEVALEGDIPVEEAKKYLEQLASKGFAEMRVTKNGVIVYVFPEFMHSATNTEFEDL